jgi:hypothetical protein
MAGKWQQAEIAALTTMAVEENKPLIPVLLDQDTPVPALLRSRSRLGLEQFDQLVEAVYGRTSKPPLGPTRKESTVYPSHARVQLSYSSSFRPWEQVFNVAVIFKG